MVQTFRAFLDFCYIARRNVHDTKSLAALADALERFHKYRVVFEECGVRPDGFALPRQHSLVHYLALIRAFGAPNGLCSSITESKHIKAVKEPWRRSSRFEALGQMLLTNQRLDKLAASRVHFTKRGMLKHTCLESALLGLRESLNFARDMWSNTDSFLTIEPHDNIEATVSVRSADDDDNTNEDDDNQDDGAVVGPKVWAQVNLAKTVCEWRCIPSPLNMF